MKMNYVFDKNHLHYRNYFNASNTEDLQAYFNAYRELIKSSAFNDDYFNFDKANMMNAISNRDNIDEKIFEDLNKHCSIDHLKVANELPRMEKNVFDYKNQTDPDVINNVQLRTVKLVQKRNEFLKIYSNRPFVRSCLKYASEKIITYEKSINPLNCLKPINDILIYVRVYKPFSSRSISDHYYQSQKASLHSTIAMHGSQTLNELKDKIFCFSDNSVSKECSESPFRLKVPNAKDVYKSGFFFIEGTFYNDFRDPINKDNSKVIRDWADRHRYGTYLTAKMEDTKIGSLTLNFGFPYLYQHQGDCEHLIVFSFARMVNPTDELAIDCYPRIVRLKPFRAKNCITCGLYSGIWIVTKSKKLPHNPGILCEFCFQSYNYIKDKKIGEFKAYPFPYDSNFDSQLRDA